MVDNISSRSPIRPFCQSLFRRVPERDRDVSVENMTVSASFLLSLSISFVYSAGYV